MDIENVILAKVHEDDEGNSEAILKSEKLQQDLFFMERVLMENVFQSKLAAYRQLPVLKGIFKKVTMVRHGKKLVVLLDIFKCNFHTSFHLLKNIFMQF